LPANGSTATAPTTPSPPTSSEALTAGHRVGVHELIRLSRIRAGLSFRQASTLSRRLSNIFADHRYFAAPGTLSDYEKLASPLNHVQKAISLCALYYINFWALLRASGISINSLGAEAMDDGLMPRLGADDSTSPSGVSDSIQSIGDDTDFLSSLIEQWEEIPLFIKDALPAISGMKGFSLADIFYVGANQEHDSLRGAVLVSVNRRFKRPAPSTATSIWEQPLYVLMRRDGSYLCAPCEVQGDALVVHPHCEPPLKSLRFKKGVDAEIIGRITAILRKLP
jgi:hypothetical protein